MASQASPGTASNTGTATRSAITHASQSESPPSTARLRTASAHGDVSITSACTATMIGTATMRSMR